MEVAMRSIRFLLAFAAMAAVSAACGQSPDLAQRLERLAEAGNGEARYHLGMLYNNGIGVPQDARRAFAEFRAAARAGDPLGAYKLGCYYAGQFGREAVAPDEALALRWKLVAARAGYSLAQLDVAIHHARRDRWAEAFPWFTAAARQGDAQSLYNLSVLYTDGRGTERSRPHAWATFRLSQLLSRRELTDNAEAALAGIWDAMNAAERAQAERLAASFVTGPTELTRRAMSGIERAEQVAAAR
jgi:TPR repeat protein